MNVGHGRPRFQIVKLLISYRLCPSTNCNFFKYLSLASLDWRMSKYLDKKALEDFLDGSAALTFAVIFLLKLSKQQEVVLQYSSRVATVATGALKWVYSDANQQNKTRFSLLRRGFFCLSLPYDWLCEEVSDLFYYRNVITIAKLKTWAPYVSKRTCVE